MELAKPPATPSADSLVCVKNRLRDTAILTITNKIQIRAEAQPKVQCILNADDLKKKSPNAAIKQVTTQKRFIHIKILWGIISIFKPYYWFQIVLLFL